MKRSLKTWTFIALIVTVIGLISFICKTRGVNAGAFIFPGIITLRLFVLQKSNDARKLL